MLFQKLLRGDDVRAVPELQPHPLLQSGRAGRGRQPHRAAARWIAGARGMAARERMKAAPLRAALPRRRGLLPRRRHALHSATQVPVVERPGRPARRAAALRSLPDASRRRRRRHGARLRGARHAGRDARRAEGAARRRRARRGRRSSASSASSRSSSTLPHDHIVEVLDFQPTDDGTFALVMEFLDGEELRATLKREKRHPPERIVRMLAQTAHRARRGARDDSSSTAISSRTTCSSAGRAKATSSSSSISAR